MEIEAIHRYYSRLLIKVKDPVSGEELRVVYRGFRGKDLRGELGDYLHGRGGNAYDALAFFVTALPDVTDDGRPVKADAALFNRLDLRTATAIAEAVIESTRELFAPFPFHLYAQGYRRTRKYDPKPTGHVAEWRGEE